MRLPNAVFASGISAVSCAGGVLDTPHGYVLSRYAPLRPPPLGCPPRTNLDIRRRNMNFLSSLSPPPRPPPMRKKRLKRKPRQIRKPIRDRYHLIHLFLFTAGFLSILRISLTELLSNIPVLWKYPFSITSTYMRTLSINRARSKFSANTLHPHRSSEEFQVLPGHHSQGCAHESGSERHYCRICGSSRHSLLGTTAAKSCAGRPLMAAEDGQTAGTRGLYPAQRRLW